MMNKESPPLQQDMFSGQLVDNRSRYQKRQDKTRRQPQQMVMFRLKDMVEIGVSVRPWLKDLPAPRLELESEDPRTAEEKEHDLLREAQALTAALFAAAEMPEREGEQASQPETQPQPVSIPVAVLNPPVEGYRRRARRAKIRLRSRIA